MCSNSTSLYKITLKADAVSHAATTPRRIPLPYHEKVKSKLERMQSLGVIEIVAHPTEWVSPMVVVSKQNGTVRICVDIDYTPVEHYQLPTAEELFANNIQRAKFFTTPDAASDFGQIPLANHECLDLITFLTPHGRFRFTRSTLGLNSGSEIFHRAP